MVSAGEEELSDPEEQALAPAGSTLGFCIVPAPGPQELGEAATFTVAVTVLCSLVIESVQVRVKVVCWVMVLVGLLVPVYKLPLRGKLKVPAQPAEGLLEAVQLAARLFVPLVKVTVSPPAATVFLLGVREMESPATTTFTVLSFGAEAVPEKPPPL